MCDDHSEHLAEMRRLVEDLAAQHRREQQAYRDGFRDGFRDGDEVGYGRRLHEEAMAWEAHRERYRPFVNMPIRTEFPRRTA